MKKNLTDELVSIAVQYRNDLKHPLSDSGSIDRRLTWVNEVLSEVDATYAMADE
jgi:hypothetical protein